MSDTVFSEDIKNLIKLIYTHIEKYKSPMFKLHYNKALQDFENSDIKLIFKKADTPVVQTEFFPMRKEDIKSYLFDKDKVNRKGERMIPMISAASEKKADYLMCQITDWDLDLSKVIEVCFEETEILSDNEFLCKSNEIDDLQGVILYDKTEYVIIYNSQIEYTKLT